MSTCAREAVGEEDRGRGRREEGRRGGKGGREGGWERVEEGVGRNKGSRKASVSRTTIIDCRVSPHKIGY